jgi:hypothetical protein
MLDGSGGPLRRANELLASRYDFFTLLWAAKRHSRRAIFNMKLALLPHIYW